MTLNRIPDPSEDQEKEYNEAIAKALALFQENIENTGPIDNPKQEGFIALARAGSKVWNAWRKTYPNPVANFSGIHFKNSNWIDFSRFIFSADRRKRKSVDFSNCVFHEFASFSSAAFGNSTNFSNTVFLSTANFSSSSFRPGAKFHGAVFFQDAFFDGSNFGLGATFDGAEFRGRAQFKSTLFSDRSKFEGCIFRAEADFSASDKISDDKTKKALRSISFNGSVFNGPVDFSGREFLSRTEFSTTSTEINTSGNESAKIDKRKIKAGTRTEFSIAPKFHGAKLHQDTSFEGASFLDHASADATRSYRTLKLAMEQLKATREEQRFFRLEMKAERPSLSAPRQALSLLYEWCSDYGLSLWRPVAALILFSIFFGCIHGILANECAERPECAASAEPSDSYQRTSDIIKYVLVNVAPVPGLDKMQTDLRNPLFGQHGWIAVTAIVFEILHKIVALLMTFLFALGLRNLFKMKS